VGSVRQTATILHMSQEHLRTGDKATVRFRFIKMPEFLKPDMRMVFREGRTKAVGTVTKLFPHVSAQAQNTRQQRASKKAVEANHHQMKPQNEPKKPSKKNRRSRNRGPYHSASEDVGAEGEEKAARNEGAEGAAAAASTSATGVEGNGVKTAAAAVAGVGEVTAGGN
jgi:hypothetical protein